MFERFRLSLLTVLVLGVTSARAQPLPASLVDAVKSAVLTSPDVQEKWKAYRASQQLRPMARAGWLPKADASVSGGRGKFSVLGVDYGWNAVDTNEVTLSQLLFDGRVVSSAVRGAGLEQQQAYHAVTEASEAVALETVRAYLDLLRYQEVVDASTENYVEHKRTVDMLNERVRATVGRRVDLEQGNARLARAESALTTDSIDLHNASARYLRMVGTVAPAKLPAWPEDLAVGKVPASAEAVLQQGISANPALQGALAQLQAADEAVLGRNRALYMPRVDARLSERSSRNMDGIMGRVDKTVAELALTQNIYRGGYDKAQETRAEEAAKRARAAVEQTCRTVRETMSVAYKDVVTLAQQTALRDQHRLSVEKVVTGYRQQFDIGQRTLLDLLDTQNELLASNRNYILARYDHLIAQARVLASMGQLVPTLRSGRADWAPQTQTPEGPAALDPAAYCAAEVTSLDSLDRYKTVPERPQKLSYVVLLPDADGGVGSVVVRGPGGEQVVSKAQQGVPLSASQPPSDVAAAEIEKDFGAALKAQPPMPERFTLLFEPGTARLSKLGQEAWANIVERLKARQTLDVSVEGYADTVGSSQLNEALALKRAQLVAQKLRQSGYRDVEMAVVSFGKRKLAIETPDETSEPRNRRVVLTVR